MSQKAFLAAFDAQFFEATRGTLAGGDEGQYTAPGAVVSLPARVFVDRGLQDVGQFGTVTAAQVTVRYVDTTFEPVAGGKIVVDDDIWINVRPVDDQRPGSVWVVRRG